MAAKKVFKIKSNFKPMDYKIILVPFILSSVNNRFDFLNSWDGMVNNAPRDKAVTYVTGGIVNPERNEGV